MPRAWTVTITSLTWIGSVPPRGSGWMRQLSGKSPYGYAPTRYREVVLTRSKHTSQPNPIQAHVSTQSDPSTCLILKTAILRLLLSSWTREPDQARRSLYRRRERNESVAVQLRGTSFALKVAWLNR